MCITDAQLLYEMDPEKQLDDILQSPTTSLSPEQLSNVLLNSVNSDPSMNMPMNLVQANHPMLSFPLRTIGQQRRAFCSYLQYIWLHYQESSDSVSAFTVT